MLISQKRLLLNAVYFLVLTFGALILIQTGITSRVDAAPGESSNVLVNQVVSYINATCDADPLNCSGSYHSKYSFSLLYVPVGSGTASVTINNVTNGIRTDGLVTLNLNPLTNAPGYVCGSPTDYELNPVSGSSVALSNPAAANIRQITNFDTGQVYNVYCVSVYTDDSKPLAARENVRFTLATAAGSLLGVFSGPQTNLGTGYFGGNGLSYNNGNPPGPNWWSQTVAFSPPCTNSGGDTTGNDSMTLYDLDTYSLANTSMRLYVDKILKPGIASAPDGGVAGVSYRIGLSGPITQLGGNVYDVNYGETGESWTIDVSGESYQSLYVYSLHIENIGSANKIRIRLPYDQINSSITCQQNAPPTGNIALVCTVSPGTTTATIYVRKGTLSDPDGDTMTMDVNIGATNSSPNTANFTNGTSASTNIVQFNSVARSATNYTVSGTVSDGNGGSVNVSGGVNCPLPAAPTITIDSSSCTTLVFTYSGEAFNYTVDLLLSGVSTGDSFSATPAQRNFNSIIPQYRDFVSKSFTVRVTNGSYGSISTTSSPATIIGPCVTASCTNSTSFSYNPTSPDAHSPFTITVGYTLAGGPVGNRIANRTLNMSLATPGSSSATPVSGTSTVGAGSNGGSIAFPNIIYTTSGSHTATATGTGLVPSPFSCNDTFVIYFRPYARFYGNDVLSCGGIAATGSSIRFSGGYSGGPGPGTYIGAASQLAVFAVQNINGLMSGSQYTSRSTPWDLAFANNSGTALAGLSFGGSIGNCPSTATRTIGTGTAINSVGSITSSGAYVWSDLTSSLAGQIQDGERAVVYATGDVTIGNNVTYQNTSWGNTNLIPSLTLIVDGDIYINSAVTQLDGHYIATGDIYTCSSGTGNLRDLTGAQSEAAPRSKSNFLVNNCNSRLLVNGSFKANRVHFLRSNGTTGTGTPYEPYTSGNIAEVFRFSPEVYLTNGGGTGVNTSNSSKFDSIVSRPPTY